jgi:hypothetical protein
MPRSVRIDARGAVRLTGTPGTGGDAVPVADGFGKGWHRRRIVDTLPPGGRMGTARREPLPVQTQLAIDGGASRPPSVTDDLLGTGWNVQSHRQRQATNRP